METSRKIKNGNKNRIRPTGIYQESKNDSIEPIIPSLIVTSPITTTNNNSNFNNQTNLEQRRPSSISYLQDSPEILTDESHNNNNNSQQQQHQTLTRIITTSSAEDSMNRLLAMESDDIYSSRLSIQSQQSNSNSITTRSTPSPTPSTSTTSTSSGNRGRLPTPPSPSYSTTILNRNQNQRINLPHPLPSPPIPPPSYRSPTPTSTPTSYFPLESLRKYAESDSTSNSTTNLNLYHNSKEDRSLPFTPSSNLSSPNRSPILGSNGGSTAIYPDWKTFTSTSANTPSEEKDENYGGLPYPMKETYSSPSKVPMYKKRWFWITVIVVCLIGGGGAAAAGILLSKKSTVVVVPDGSLSGATDTPIQAPTGVLSSISGSPASPSSTTSTARRLVVFGASYCDNGHPRPSEYTSTLRAAPYYQGRASNGIVWDEYLAQELLGPSTELRNYAYSGAMVDNSITYAAIPDTKQQIASYIADIKSGLIPHLPAGGKTLIAIWVGLNPVMTSYTFINPSNPPSTKQIDNANSILSTTATSVLAQVSSLQVQLSNLLPVSSQQSFDILLLPLPPTEILPWAHYTAAAGNSGGLNLIKSMTEIYNNGLMNGMNNLNGGNYTRGRGSVVSYDIVALYQGWMSNPNSANVTNVLGACVDGSATCPTPLSHFWWDSIHMTTAIHQKVAQALAPSILSLWKK